ncbi:MAG: hypothetical protein AAGB29_02805 [Planctomycetota bacterium]
MSESKLQQPELAEYWKTRYFQFKSDYIRLGNNLDASFTQVPSTPFAAIRGYFLSGLEVLLANENPDLAFRFFDYVGSQATVIYHAKSQDDTETSFFTYYDLAKILEIGALSNSILNDSTDTELFLKCSESCLAGGAIAKSRSGGDLNLLPLHLDLTYIRMQLLLKKPVHAASIRSLLAYSQLGGEAEPWIEIFKTPLIVEQPSSLLAAALTRFFIDNCDPATFGESQMSRHEQLIEISGIINLYSSPSKELVSWSDAVASLRFGKPVGVGAK